ncbi:MAG: tRNA uridine-5-carboxymethylaminomethyl(34) synthesis GTPase MnmE [Eubacteriales bacterium]|nr:tRNA uridine-5-carboxymethylaminomethyl(34) synthesis GTPase MnmE [Eubacteriales bacterium]
MKETIAAISSGMTKSGIGIIRISGPESRSIAEKIFYKKSGAGIKLDIPSHIYYGFIKNVSRETSDEVLVLNMPAPHSFTGEDTVEIDCHGGILMMRRVLEAVLDAGARMAEPGEFTKRAFINGRIDLSQAEAVIDVINAKNDNAIRASVGQLKGELSECIKDLRSIILNKTAYIESALDDPEHYSLDGLSDELEEETEGLLETINFLIRSYDRGKIISDGINTVIIGKPNAGKSSLLNNILGEERAIVSQIPGTTRDIISETCSIGNVTLNIIDTAGIRETADTVEKIGVKKALEYADKADLILCVIDSSLPFDNSDKDIFNYIKNTDAKVLFLLNKSDLDMCISEEDIKEAASRPAADILTISAKEGSGIERLYEYIDKMFSSGDLKFNDEMVISSIRHKQLLEKAKEALEGLRSSIETGLPEDFYTVDLMEAYGALGEIIGEEVDEDLINEIFSKFCMGK